MAEVTAFPATTVHRLLGLVPNGNGMVSWAYGIEEPLPHGLVIVDESSMLDSEVAGHLFSSIEYSRTSVVLMGDANQLPSVGPGYVLGDIIASGRVPVARLTEVHRSAAESWVCVNAPKILEGSMDRTKTADFAYHRRPFEKIPENVTTLVTKTMPAAGVRDVQVLTPQNGGPLGVDAMNAHLQVVINPPCGEPSVSVMTRSGTAYQLQRGDRVLQIRNDYDRMVFNGEVGVIAAVHPPSGKNQARVIVDFSESDVEDRFVDYVGSQVQENLRLAYALTIHKAQGSEWDWVVVLCHAAHRYMWTRQLLYTAVTRAKKGVILVGNDEGVEAALARPEDPRSTALPQFLRIAP
jgi:exodeoxyribonuclease V alpha subunit